MHLNESSPVFRDNLPRLVSIPKYPYKLSVTGGSNK
ncbi:hypothetical protein DFA_02139 [Cavenderia fasciculata]|uniref:Uncharacterized protein n=1 Tax=Cavenderia fasciculata TaxID=261658 RepID=F4PYT6_CACFS|nr:uncharacterized protein DFA_02139 [Cavenderia fasciculata]EGG19352.1 hypothetical protein DFA_02139 [Cavenderia fasciculata]|eukprot:XP_004357623.1 hypothetical protein DFA_02139 [Cavenderia fasciculata]